MSEVNTEVVDSTTQTPPPEVPPPQPLDFTSDPAFRRIKDDLAKQKDRARELEQENNRLKEEKLRANKDWEEIAKIKESEANEAKQRYDHLQKALVNKEKLDAVKVEAIKQGINKDALSDLDLLDFPEIEIETTSSGKIIVHGAQQAVANLKLRRKHWFFEKPASINPQSPETNSATNKAMTLDLYTSIQAEYKKNPTPENKQKWIEAHKRLQNKS